VERFTLAAYAFKGDQPERTHLNGTLEEAAASVSPSLIG